MLYYTLLRLRKFISVLMPYKTFLNFFIFMRYYALKRIITRYYAIRKFFRAISRRYAKKNSRENGLSSAEPIHLFLPLLRPLSPFVTLKQGVTSLAYLGHKGGQS